jgi:type IV pilus assembly protein PilA
MLIRLRKRGKKGFTLIELMIVVAIIGILAAIAIPNFLRFQAKSKQSEAKTNLKAIFTAETSYFGENNSFANLSTVNYSPVGTRFLYAYSTGSDNAGNASYVTEAQGAPSVGFDNVSFTAGAAGNIDNDNTVDVWTINNNNQLTNTTDDVSS